MSVSTEAIQNCSRTFLRWFALLLPLTFVVSACGYAQSGRRDVLERLRQQYPCQPSGMTVHVVKDVDSTDACVLAIVALHQVAVGHAAAIGVLPADTARIGVAVVTSLRFPNLARPQDTAQGGHWDVTLLVRCLRYGVGVQIDQLSGRISLHKAETSTLEATYRDSSYCDDSVRR